MRRIMMLAAASLALLACSHDGRDLATPTRPAPVTTIAPATTTSVPQIASAPGFDLSSPAIPPSGALPATYTCDGAGTSPPLAWTGVPAGTVELALSVTDPDAGGFVHWVVTGLSPQLTSIGEGALPEGANEAVNSAGAAGWAPACPPAGPAHDYVFTLYALDHPSGIPVGADGRSAITTLEATANQTTLSATYQRP